MKQGSSETTYFKEWMELNSIVKQFKNGFYALVDMEHDLKKKTISWERLATYKAATEEYMKTKKKLQSLRGSTLGSELATEIARRFNERRDATIALLEEKLNALEAMQRARRVFDAPPRPRPVVESAADYADDDLIPLPPFQSRDPDAVARDAQSRRDRACLAKGTPSV